MPPLWDLSSSSNQAELFSNSLAVTMEGLRDTGQPAQGWESQLFLWPVVTTGAENSSPRYEQDPTHGVLPLLTKKPFHLQAAAHSTARRPSPAWSEQPLASDSKKSLKHSEAHASSLTGSLRSLYGTNQPEVTQTTLKICKSLPIMIIQKGSWHQNPLPSPPV